MSAGAKAAAWICGIVGVLLIVVGIVYYVSQPADLPSFFPGHDKAGLRHHRRGAFFGVIGLVFVFISVAVAYYRRPAPVRD